MAGLALGLEQAGAYVAKNGLCNDNGRCDFRKGRLSAFDAVFHAEPNDRVTNS
jgi:hypothetical protein